MKILTLVASLLLVACGGAPADPPLGEVRQAEDRETVFDPLTGQIDKAKAVDDTVRQHKEEIDAALRDADDR